MKLLWSLLAIIFALTVTAEISGFYLNTHADNHLSSSSIASSSASASGNSSEHYPSDSHRSDEHCHGPCFQFLNVPVIEFTLLLPAKAFIPSNFGKPKAPDIEGSRKPPKLA